MKGLNNKITISRGFNWHKWNLRN